MCITKMAGALFVVCVLVCLVTSSLGANATFSGLTNSSDEVISPDERPCDWSPCQHNGTCVNIGVTDFQCTCIVGYYGDRCEHALPCTGSQCKNGGTCQITDRTSYTCTCQDGFWGQHCEHAHPCTSAPCHNGATCTSTNNTSYLCTCTDSYYGDQCQHQKPCVLPRCHNGGRCVDVGDGDFRCECLAGRTGRLCEAVVNCGLAAPTLATRNATISPYHDSPSGWSTQYGRHKDCQCLPGYHTKRGYCRVRCKADGVWKMEGQCLPRDCGVPPEIDNAETGQMNDTKYRAVVEYTCVSGYTMRRNHSVTCGTNGRWVPLKGARGLSVCLSPRVPHPHLSNTVTWSG